MAIYDLEIQLFHSFFGALKLFFDFFVFSVKISKLYRLFYRLQIKFSKLTKCLIPRGSFKQQGLQIFVLKLNKHE